MSTLRLPLLLPVRLNGLTLLGESNEIRPARRTTPVSGLRLDHTDPDVDYDLGDAGDCDGRLKLFTFLIDDSGSVIGPGGNDPVSRRYAEARLAVRELAEACTCGREFVAVRHFDGAANHPPYNLPPQPIAKRRLAERVRTALHQPSGGGFWGTSDLGPALTDARAFADRMLQHHRDAEVQLIIMSDFELTDPDPSRVISGIETFPGIVLAFLLGADRSTSSVLTSSHIDTVPLDANTPPGALAAELFMSLVNDRPGHRYA